MSNLTNVSQIATDLLPLLTKLATLAPEVCLYEHWYGHYKFNLNSLNHTIDIVSGQPVNAIDYAALQWAVQSAIVARGWDWGAYNIDQKRDPKWFEAEVSNPLDGCGGIVHLRDATSPAIALLLAFLQALEAAQ